MSPLRFKPVWQRLKPRLPQFQPQQLVFLQAGSTPEATVSRFGDWCAEHPGVRAHVVLSGALTRQYVLPQPAVPLMSRTALDDFARRYFVQFYGASASAWPLDTWRDARTHGASVVHGVGLEALHRAAAPHGVRLQALEPWWAWMLRWLTRHYPRWSHTLPAAPVVLLLVEGTLLTWLECQGQCVLQIQQRRLHTPTWAALHECAAHLQAAYPTPAPVWAAGFGLEDAAPPAVPGWTFLNRLDSAALPAALLS